MPCVPPSQRESRSCSSRARMVSERLKSAVSMERSLRFSSREEKETLAAVLRRGRIPLLALRAWMFCASPPPPSHASPKRKREESAPHSHNAPRIPLLALRAWMRKAATLASFPCKPEAQARESASSTYGALLATGRAVGWRRCPRRRRPVVTALVAVAPAAAWWGEWPASAVGRRSRPAHPCRG